MNCKKITGRNVRDAYEWLRANGCGCYHFRVWTDWDHPKEREYDIVIGWHDGGDGWEVYSKIAFQDRNNAMQCDFDVDWLMPYDEETGDVYDTCDHVPDCGADDAAAEVMNKFNY